MLSMIASIVAEVVDGWWWCIGITGEDEEP